MSGLESLSPAKRALLERELAKRRAAAAGAGDTIPRRAPGTPVPLSSTQRRMWFLAQWAPESFTFNASRAIRLRGPLDRTALATALRGVVGRHESLRTLVDPSGPEPLQRVLDDWELAGPGRAVDEGGLDARLRQLSQEPFDLTAELPIRATLLELGPEDHVLLLRIHHFAADAHSDSIMFDELSQLYAGAVGGREVELPEIPVQYADYTLWQESHLTGARLERLVDYWRRELEGAPELLNLPTDRPRPSVQRNLGAHQRLTFDRELAQSLIELARSEGATFYIATLAAFVAVLYRRSGADDIVIGSPDRQPHACRAAAGDRFLLQHAGAAPAARRKSKFPGAPRARPRHRDPGLRTSGAAVREGRGGGGAATQSWLQPALPGQLPLSGQRSQGAVADRPGGGGARCRHRLLQVRPGARARAARHCSGGIRRIRHGPVRRWPRPTA